MRDMVIDAPAIKPITLVVLSKNGATTPGKPAQLAIDTPSIVLPVSLESDRFT